MIKYLAIVSLFLIGCTPVDSVEEQVDSQDRAMFEADSVKYFNYIIERDSLKLIENRGPDIDARIEMLSKEIDYYRDKWGKYLN